MLMLTNLHVQVPPGLRGVRLLHHRRGHACPPHPRLHTPEVGHWLVLCRYAFVQDLQRILLPYKISMVFVINIFIFCKKKSIINILSACLNFLVFALRNTNVYNITHYYINYLNNMHTRTT